MITRKETINSRIKRVREDFINGKYIEREFVTLAIPLEDEYEKISIILSSLKMNKKKF